MALDFRDVPNVWMQELGISGRSVGAVADNSATGGVLLCFPIVVPDGATGDVDVTVAEKIRVVDVHAVKTGGASAVGNAVQLKNAGAAISNNMDTNVADTTVVRATLIDDAQHTINAGGTLRVTRTKAGGDASALVVVYAVKVA